VPVAVEDGQGVVLAEVFPLQQRIGKERGERLDEFLHQRFVRGSAQPVAAPAEIQVVLQQRPVVGADVETDRQGLRRVDAGARGVQRQLADGDGHAAGALIADAEDGLVVGDHRQADVASCRRGFQHLADAAAVRRRDPHAAAALERPR
jgi:hypothetical protein